MFHEIKEYNLVGDHASRLEEVQNAYKILFRMNENKLSESPKHIL